MKIKNFVITGAGSFLGRAIAGYLIKRYDVKLFLTSRKKYQFSVLKKFPSRISYLGGIDLLKKDNLEELAKAVNSFFPEQFHVINCAGGYWEHFPLVEVSFEQSIKTIEENLHTVFGAAYFLAPLMRERKGGHFISFGCNSTRYCYPWMAPFTAAKQGVATLMKSLCAEYGRYNIQFNCFVLVTLKTKREKEFKPFGDHKKWLEPKDIANAVFNLTQQDNNLINGSEINLFKYSEQYNWKGYFERIRKE